MQELTEHLARFQADAAKQVPGLGFRVVGRLGFPQESGASFRMLYIYMFYVD